MSDGDDEQFAADLARLPLPRPSAVRMGYAAGLAAGRRRSWAWRAAAGVAAGVAVILAVRRPPLGPSVYVDRIVYRSSPGATMVPTPPVADASSVLRLSDLLLSDSRPLPPPDGRGGRQLPQTEAWMAEPPSLRQ